MITPSNFQIFISSGNVVLGQAYSQAPSVYKQYADTMPSGSTQEIYGWTGMLPKARQWDGPRVVNEAAPQTYVVVNRPWETTLSVDRFRLDDDSIYGILYRELPDLATQAKKLPDLWMRDLLTARGVFSGAAAQAGLDGLSYFSPHHPVDIYDSSKGQYSNDFTGGPQSQNGIAVGGALTPTGFSTLLEYMQTYAAEDGEPMNVTPSLMIVPTTLQVEANLILRAAFFSPPSWGTITSQVGAADNVLKRFGVDLCVNPYLNVDSATKWYLADTTKARKPMVWQEREAAHMAQRTSETDPVVFDSHRYVFGYWGRGAPAWAFSWLMARSGP